MLVTLIPLNAVADHIGIYSDASGASCNIPTGLTSTATVIHKFAIGAMGSRFKLEFPPGSAFFGFSTNFTMTGSFESEALFSYGTCQQGSFVVGSIIAVLTQGLLMVRPANEWLIVTTTDCNGVEHPGTCGGVYVGLPYTQFCASCEPLPTAQHTWGAVKALYR
jgi:hypothetical protein